MWPGGWVRWSSAAMRRLDRITAALSELLGQDSTHVVYDYEALGSVGLGPELRPQALKHDKNPKIPDPYTILHPKP